MDTPIPVQSRKQLKELFTEKKLENQWFSLWPNSPDALKCAPSSSSKEFTSVYGCDNDIKQFLSREFDKIFDKQGHVASFWDIDGFEMNLTQSLGLTYRELACRTNGKLGKYSEAQLQHMVLNPLLRGLSKAAMIIPSIKDEAIKTDFLVQDQVEMVSGKKGSKPTIDAMIQISRADDDKVVTCVPIEMKVDMNIEHYSQIACYINKLSTVKELTKYVMIGIIIDKKQFRMAFSAYRKGDIPLPLVHVSPPTQWRSEDTSMIDQCAMLSLACTFLTGQLERQEYTKAHCGEMSTDDLTELGKQLLQNPHELGKPETQSVHWRSLKQEYDKKLAAQGFKIAKLEEIVNDLKSKDVESKKAKVE